LHFGPCFFWCFFWWSLLVKIGNTQSISMFIDVLLGGGLSRRVFCIIDECFQASLRQIDVFFREFSFKHPKVQATEVCNVAPPVCLWNFIDLYRFHSDDKSNLGETTTSYGWTAKKPTGQPAEAMVPSRTKCGGCFREAGDLPKGLVKIFSLGFSGFPAKFD